MSSETIDPNKCGDPGAVTVGYIPERPKFGFKTAPERDHSWRDLVIVQGVLTERDSGDEDKNAGDSENAR